MRTRNFLKIASLCAVLALGTALALAGPHGRGHHPGPMHGPGPGGPMDPEFMLDRMAERLDLTAEQQARIEQILESHRADADARRDALQAAHEAYRDLIDSDAYDEAAVRAAAQQVAAAQVEAMVDRAMVRNEVHAVLTPAQLAQAKAMREERQERRFERRHGDGPGRF